VTSASSGTRTAAAISANSRRTQAAVQRVHQALAGLRRDRAQITVAAVARRAGVSRTFLYDNPAARTAVATAAAQDGQPPRRTPAAPDEQEATWRERALNAEDALKAAHTEIRTQRARIGELLGQVRDLEAEWSQDAVQRITTENTTLRQRLRQLTAGNRTLEERLQAARSNLRFQDRRVADLEARIAEPLTRTSIPAARRPADVATPGGHTIPDALPKNATDM
jgi:chromosome segregation ATPase